MGLFRKRRTVNLALQGGGAHGAFTWGVLDRLLEEKDLEFGWISGTSAGAINACAFASGWARGGREGARENLGALWKAVYKAGVPELLRLNPFLHSLSRSPTLARMAGMWSPYDINPLRINPLRELLVATIDFDLIRKKGAHELLIAATDVATGNARLFRRGELDIKCVLASACLPTIHHAVEIEGRSYWDGGFSANPDIVTLASESPIGDTLIVQLNSLVQSKTPREVGEIASQINQITFNAPLKRDVELVSAAREMYERTFSRPSGPLSALARHRFHLIDSGHYTGSLSPQTKMKPDWGLFTYLFDAGRIKTEKWLQNDSGALGRRSSVDLAEHFLRRPGMDTKVAPAKMAHDLPVQDDDDRGASSEADASNKRARRGENAVDLASKRKGDPA